MSQPLTVDEVKKKLTDILPKIVLIEKDNALTIRTVGGVFIEGLNELLKDRVGASYVKEQRGWTVPVRVGAPPPPQGQKSLPQSPAVDSSERKFVVEELARIASERFIQGNPEMWMLQTVARGMLLLLEEKK